MAIKSKPFGGIELSDEDATSFVEHVETDGPNQNAIDLYERGKAISRHAHARRPSQSVKGLKGMIKANPAPVSIEDMNAAIIGCATKQKSQKD